eukprot:TRINITY_DN6530_c0_g1_i2.p1 TRINITY_DN6530_c0_g1~~TRINITY_DN6530_c0_g1_i2.p1  ORF type:complete len:101 (+),score=0.12 TRINITY_DN6530_c0_g1_i2:189-491(+)
MSFQFINNACELYTSFINQEIRKKSYCLGALLYFLVNLLIAAGNGEVLFCFAFALSYFAYFCYLLQLKGRAMDLCESLSFAVRLHELLVDFCVLSYMFRQ